MSKQLPKSLSNDTTAPLVDLLKVAGFTMIPFGTSFLGWYFIAPPKAQTKWLTKVNKSSWLPQSAVAALEIATVLPMGYALYLVTKDEISNRLVKTALGMFGILMIVNLGGIYTFSRVKQSNWWIGSSTMITISAFLTADAFGKVNHLARLLMLPFAFWISHQTIQLIFFRYKTTSQP